jgi:hypothetical protein
MNYSRAINKNLGKIFLTIRAKPGSKKEGVTGIIKQ